jgi:hypothetical protein
MKVTKEKKANRLQTRINRSLKRKAIKTNNMKNKLALIAAVAILGGSAKAATYNFSNAGTGTTGDLMMGFYSSGGTGSGLEVVFDLGAPTSTSLSPAAYTLNLTSVLNSYYGSNWTNSANITVGLLGADAAGDGSGYAGSIGQIWANTTAANLNATYGISTDMLIVAAAAVQVEQNFGLGVTTGTLTTNGNTFSWMEYNAASANASFYSKDSTAWDSGFNNGIMTGIQGAKTWKIAYLTDGIGSQSVGSVSYDGVGNIAVTSVPEPSQTVCIVAGSVFLLLASKRLRRKSA